MRQSFIRKPGMEQVLVRIGIGRDGIYKVDGVENKVRVHLTRTLYGMTHLWMVIPLKNGVSG